MCILIFLSKILARKCMLYMAKYGHFCVWYEERVSLISLFDFFCTGLPRCSTAFMEVRFRICPFASLFFPRQEEPAHSLGFPDLPVRHSPSPSPPKGTGATYIIPHLSGAGACQTMFPFCPQTDYINASFMDGYKQKNAYIGTQGKSVCPSQVGFESSTCDSCTRG